MQTFSRREELLYLCCHAADCLTRLIARCAAGAERLKPRPFRRPPALLQLLVHLGLRRGGECCLYRLAHLALGRGRLLSREARGPLLHHRLEGTLELGQQVLARLIQLRGRLARRGAHLVVERVDRQLQLGRLALIQRYQLGRQAALKRTERLVGGLCLCRQLLCQRLQRELVRRVHIALPFRRAHERLFRPARVLRILLHHHPQLATDGIDGHLQVALQRALHVDELGRLLLLSHEHLRLAPHTRLDLGSQLRFTCLGRRRLHRLGARLGLTCELSCQAGHGLVSRSALHPHIVLDRLDSGAHLLESLCVGGLDRDARVLELPLLRVLCLEPREQRKL
mmetsp:Transcript_36677/g.109068  ORF Transcript_36677/g.109068 Transcript_36677/m.109068 type:complete len:339 (-) Transcript_36677:1646-2662(-)